MRNPHRSILLFLPLIFLSLAPAAAHAILPGGDVSFGYSYLGANTIYTNAPGLNGWDAAGHLKLMPLLGAEVDVAHYGYGAAASVVRTTTYMAGPRVTLGAAGIHVFARILVGGRHSANSGGPTPISANGFVGDGGGGADFRIAPFFAMRIRADYLNKSYRLGTGLVFRF